MSKKQSLQRASATLADEVAVAPPTLPTRRPADDAICGWPQTGEPCEYSTVSRFIDASGNSSSGMRAFRHRLQGITCWLRPWEGDTFHPMGLEKTG